jgi:hypothetical protein
VQDRAETNVNLGKLQMRVGIVVIGAGLVLAPAAPAWASSGHHKTKPKKKATTASATCPSAAAIGTAAGTTYTGPVSQAGYQKGWTVCNYSANGQVAVLLSLYPSGTSLQEISANASQTKVPVRGLGNSAVHAGTTQVYVSRTSGPSFSVIDELSDLTLAKVEAIAKAELAN